MTAFLFPPATPSLAVTGLAARFAVRRIWCVGSNYRKPDRDYSRREPPYFFSKQPDMLVADGGAVRHPGSGELRFEVELVVAIGKDGAIFGHATGLDMTRRDLLLAAQESGKPWEIGKSFEDSAPVGAITPAARPLQNGAIRLAQNGALRQNSDIDQMIWNIPEIISRLSGLVTLAAGDLIFTGTPSGHGPCRPGDHIEAVVEGLTPVRVTVR
jgi:fumarylpyruvate hydrolase